MKNISILLIFILSVGFIGCGGSGSGNPKQVVISMFGAMERDDKGALAHLLDLNELMKSTNQDYALNSDNPRTFISPEQVLEDLTGDGKTKTRWFSYQRIVNEEQIVDNSATVEVTFVDKDNSQGYKVKFGLHILNGKWKIYSFNTL